MVKRRTPHIQTEEEKQEYEKGRLRDDRAYQNLVFKSLPDFSFLPEKLARVGHDPVILLTEPWWIVVLGGEIYRVGRAETNWDARMKVAEAIMEEYETAFTHTSNTKLATLAHAFKMPVEDEFHNRWQWGWREKAGRKLAEEAK